MKLKYDIEIKNSIIKNEIKKLINQIYKLLPSWEENIDWKKPLETIIEELAGMDRVFTDQHNIFFPIICKLEGLFICQEHEFQLFRRTIFEVLGLMGSLKDNLDD